MDRVEGLINFKPYIETDAGFAWRPGINPDFYTRVETGERLWNHLNLFGYGEASTLSGFTAGVGARIMF